MVSLCTKFEVCKFRRSLDVVGVQNYKSKSRDVAHALSDLLLHFWFVGLAINQHTKLKSLALSVPEI